MIDQRLRVRELLQHEIATTDLCPGATTLEGWLAARWIRVRWRGTTIPVFPLSGSKHAHVAHDVHHLLLGYPMNLRGECELAGWDLASGGCHRHALFWLDRAFVAALGLVLYPLGMLRALHRGRGCINLYGTPVDAVLDASVDALGRRLRH